MNDKFIARILRSLIVFIMFIPLVTMQGMDLRSAQHSAMFLSTIVLFGFLLRNLWLTAFVAWSVFLFTFYRFQCGSLYLYNILIGAILYYVVKCVFRKENIDFLVNAFLWLVFINLGFMVLQQLHLDFMYKVILRTQEGVQGYIDIVDLSGLMALKAVMGMVMALAVPVLLARWNKISILGAGLLFIPIYISKSSICMAGAIIGALFVLWHKDMGKYVYLKLKTYTLAFRISSKFVWGVLVLLLCIGGVSYIALVDAPMGMLPTRLTQWKMSLRDCIIHPVVGWGLDSFRVELPWKNFIYAMNMSKSASGIHYDFWDNIHNLYINVFYEWGIVGILILGGYLRGCFLKFHKAVKEPNTLALGGFLVVLIIINFAQFPLFLARTACFIVPMMAIYDVAMEG